jgi:hypothetical protein
VRLLPPQQAQAVQTAYGIQTIFMVASPTVTPPYANVWATPMLQAYRMTLLALKRPDGASVWRHQIAVIQGGQGLPMDLVVTSTQACALSIYIPVWLFDPARS